MRLRFRREAKDRGPGSALRSPRGGGGEGGGRTERGGGGGGWVGVVFWWKVGRGGVGGRGEAVVTLALLLIVFFMVEGFAKIVFSLTIRPASKLGLGLSQRHCWKTAVFLSFGQPHHDSSLAARCVARDPAYLRRCGSQFAGVAGASERVSCGLLSIRSFQRRSERDGRSRISGGIDAAVGARRLQHRLPPLRTASWGTRSTRCKFLI